MQQIKGCHVRIQFQPANKYKSNTSLKDDIASITSFVNVLPAPDDPINTVGLID